MNSLGEFVCSLARKQSWLRLCAVDNPSPQLDKGNEQRRERGESEEEEERGERDL